MTKEELLAAFPDGVGRPQVVMHSWHRKRGARNEAADADPDWGRFDSDDYDGWEGFYIPDPKPLQLRRVVRVLSFGADGRARRPTARPQS